MASVYLEIHVLNFQLVFPWRSTNVSFLLNNQKTVSLSHFQPQSIFFLVFLDLPKIYSKIAQLCKKMFLFESSWKNKGGPWVPFTLLLDLYF